MSSYKDEKDNLKKDGGDMEADILVTDAIPTNDGGPPIPPGHSRFYCSKCQTVRFGFGTLTLPSASLEVDCFGGVEVRSIFIVVRCMSVFGVCVWWFRLLVSVYK